MEFLSGGLFNEPYYKELSVFKVFALKGLIGINFRQEFFSINP